MNEKFFNLKKEKQDRIINAALKVFADQGFLHAGTDRIVKEAGISKGLLFHYFENKLGLYVFLYDYCVRYMKLEFGSISAKGTDLFELSRQIQEAFLRAGREYPYMQQFLNRSSHENVGAALLATESKRDSLADLYESLYKQVSYENLPDRVAAAKLKNMVELTINGLLNESIWDGSFQPEMFYKDVCGYLDMMKKMVE